MIDCGPQESVKNNTMAATLVRITMDQSSMALIVNSKMVVRRARSPSAKLSNEIVLWTKKQIIIC